MRYLSICSGIEAATVAWHGLGWTPVAFSEIEPFPSAVLAHHYPHVPNLGDMTTLPERILSRELEAPDLLVGGPPCQAFSVAGLRRGLDDARGSLTLTYCEIANAIDHVRLADGRDPAIIVYENVPGLLSSKDNAFGCLLAGLAGESEELQAPRGKWRDAGVVVGPQRLAVWRVLDAQFFAVAQRRRRIFLVSVALRHPRAWAIAESIFPLSACLSWNPPPSRETRQGVARGVGGGPEGGSISGAVTRKWAKGSGGPAGDECYNMVAQPVAHALRGEGFDASEDGTGRGTPIVPVAEPVAFHPTQDPISSVDGTTHAMGCGSKQGTATVAVAIRTANTGANGHGIAVDVTHTLDQAQGQAVVQPVAQPVAGSHWDHPSNPHPTLNQSAKGSGGIAASDQELFSQRDSGLVPQPVAPALTASNDPSRSPQSSEVTQQVTAVHSVTMQVRRLTPVECSRLQGFPDTYLELTYGTESEAHASQVLHELWKQTGAIAREGWRPGIVASLFTPEVLLAGVHGGWISWEMATCCAIAPRPLSSKVNYAERFVRRLQEAGQDGRSPYQRKSFRQLSEELGCSLSQLPLEEAQARKILLNSELWPQAQAQWPLRYALATEKQRSSGKLNADGPRYKALGNSMAVPCMRWIGERIQAATARQEVKP